MDDEPREGATTTNHAPWTKIVTLVVLAVFILSLLVGALLF
ncbi:hypothetical protein WCD74_04385 [Actinomycetospora sp. OC33-EN08]|uniref:Uncharacterized protein n=1 Tax=Actinomycetospora aurantiaca TaxID=3129233 RepID=A0ABU8MI63_9PSEU